MSETHSSKVCAICKNVKPSEAFYKNKIGHQESYVCKDCINKEIDNDIFKAIPWCDAFNIPVMPDCWNSLKRKHPDKPVFGKYLSVCKLPVYRYFGFTDNLYNGVFSTKEESKILPNTSSRPTRPLGIVFVTGASKYERLRARMSEGVK